MRQAPVKFCLFHKNFPENLAKNYVGTPPPWIWVPLKEMLDPPLEYIYIKIFTAREGYVFTPVCDSVYRGACMAGGACVLCMPPTPPGVSYYEIRSVNVRVVRVLLECTLVTGRNEVLAKVIFLHVCVILFTGGGGVPDQAGTLPDQAGTPPRPGRYTHPRGQTPPKQVPPPPGTS